MSVAGNLIKLAVHALEGAGEKEAAQTVVRKVAQRATPEAAPALAVARKAPAKAPAVIRARSSAPASVARDVLKEAAKPSKGAPSFADWWRNNPDNGALFDDTRLSEVPNVPQTQLPRYEPARGPSDRIVAALSDPEVAKQLNATVERGAEGGGLQWYNTEPLRQLMVKSSPEGGQNYSDLMDLVAATSPRARVPDNIRTASYFNYLKRAGEPLPDKPAPGYGSVAQNLHVQNARGLEENGGWDVFRNPKPASFSTNLQGNQNNVTIDTHNFRLPGIFARDPRFLVTSMVPEKGAEPLRPKRWFQEGTLSMDDAVQRPAFWDSKPNDNEYGYYERWQQDQAKKLGMSPAQYQASMWLGGGEDTGLGSAAEPFLHTLEARIKYTADRLGLDPEKVRDMFARGEIPLLAKGGAVRRSLAVTR